MPLGLTGYNGWLPSNPRRYNGWLPKSRAVHEAFLNDLAQRAAERRQANTPHVPSVQAFQTAIEANKTMINLFENTFIQVSGFRPPPVGQIQDFEDLLYRFDCIVETAPGVVTLPGEPAEPIGVPIYVCMDLLINTSAGYLLFNMPEFNTAIYALLQSWGQYLMSPASNNTLNNGPTGWFGQEGISLLQADERGIFDQTYVVPDPTAIDRGYKSWDAFFTRQYQELARPIDLTPTPGSVIYNACESTVERYESCVQLHDKFWLKGMAYSLYDMLGADNVPPEHDVLKVAEQYVGGTVYQAFLSPEDYHRWHAPVAGTIHDAYPVQGTYYAALPDDGDEGDGHFDMHGALIRSQPWLTVAATRFVITIDTHTKMGLVTLIAVGMVEVSTCEVTVKKGDTVQAGDQLGMFHFGGSSHAVIFGPQVNIAWRNPVKPGVHLHIRKIIADCTYNDQN